MHYLFDSFIFHENESDCWWVLGAIAQTAIYPMDLVKTRLQCYNQPGRAPHLVQFSKDILMHEGPLALYRGLVPSLLGMVPYAGIDLAVYETLKNMSREFLVPDTGTVFRFLPALLPARCNNVLRLRQFLWTDISARRPNRHSVQQ